MAFAPKPPAKLRLHCRACGGMDYRFAGRALPEGWVAYACDGCGAVHSTTVELALDWSQRAARA